MSQKLNKPRAFILKECTRCGGSYGPDSYIRVRSPFYTDGYAPLCNDCIEKILADHNFEWDYIDKVCQYLDVPFVPAEFEKLHSLNGDKVFSLYAAIFLNSEYEGLGWSDYFKEFKLLKEAGEIEDELPEIREAKMRKLQEKWGGNYDLEQLNYLERLETGLRSTQNVNGALQQDQAIKICKISLEVDNRIREGVDFDKMLTAYDKLVKIAEFTPKNVKNMSDFDSTGELCKWLEKRGWKNKFYDNVTRDIVDETIKNIQAWNQRLYTNESSIGEEITRRIEALQSAKELEDNSYYGTNVEFDVDNYEVDGYDRLLGDNNEFEVDLDGES